MERKTEFLPTLEETGHKVIGRVKRTAQGLAFGLYGIAAITQMGCGDPTPPQCQVSEAAARTDDLSHILLQVCKDIHKFKGIDEAEHNRQLLSDIFASIQKPLLSAQAVTFSFPESVVPNHRNTSMRLVDLRDDPSSTRLSLSIESNVNLNLGKGEFIADMVNLYALNNPNQKIMEIHAIEPENKGRDPIILFAKLINIVPNAQDLWETTGAAGFAPKVNGLGTMSNFEPGDFLDLKIAIRNATFDPQATETALKTYQTYQGVKVVNQVLPAVLTTPNR